MEKPGESWKNWLNSFDKSKQRVKAAGAKFLRGGAYKPRTSPYSFQGHGESALDLLAKAAIAAGTDALMIEVHPNPAKALSDGPQCLTPDRFDRLTQELAVIGKAVDRWQQPAAALV